MDPPDDRYEEANRRSSSSAFSARRRREAIGSRYIALLLVPSFICIVTFLLINRRLTPYFELISTTIDQPRDDNGITILNNSEAAGKSSEANPTAMEYSGTSNAQPLNPSSSHRLGLTINNAIPVELPNEEKIHTTGFGPGQFCSFCPWSKDSMCAGRLDFLMTRYQMNETAAKASLIDKCATPPIPHNVHAEDDEPSIILHVGPHKTGTTALQSFIYDLVKVNNNIFLEDNLRIPLEHELPGCFHREGVGLNLPHCSINRFKRDGGQMSNSMCGSMREAFPKFVADAYNKSQNILVVAEDFDRSLINFNRLHFLLQPYKKIKVVSTYRRLHDWLPSWYNQIADHYQLEYARGNETYPSFVEWVEEKYDKFLKAHGVTVAERFKSYEFIESVHLINMHDMADSLADTFFCDILQAKATCKAIKDGVRPSKSNIGFDHEYQRLAIEAKRAGKIPASSLEKKIQIRRVSKFLMMQVEQTNTSLPRLCPSNETLEKILTQELEHESKYLPEWSESQGGEEALRKSFEKAVQKKFCAFDVVKIFDTGIMDSIFRQERCHKEGRDAGPAFYDFSPAGEIAACCWRAWLAGSA
eukprot:scaffold25418_cov131-Skeletonema_dohrnii-CCMP3373.AAC.8